MKSVIHTCVDLVCHGMLLSENCSNFSNITRNDFVSSISCLLFCDVLEHIVSGHPNDIKIRISMLCFNNNML